MKLPPAPYGGTTEEIAAWLDILTKKADEITIKALVREKAKKKKAKKVPSTKLRG